jgi:dipeptidyl aminopeptidase/acylaminoacyl peptidase
VSSPDLAARLDALFPPELARGDWVDVTRRVRPRRHTLLLKVAVALALFVVLAAAATATYLALRDHPVRTPAPGALTLITGGGSLKSPPEIVQPTAAGLRVLWRCRGLCALMTSADWAPDGRHLAFTLDAFNSQSSRFGLHILDTRTGADWHISARESRRLGCNLFGFDRSTYSQVAWSPDSRTVAFVCAGAIRTIRQDGTHLRTVHTGISRSGSPTWSPDGTRIAFDAQGAIYVMRLDGSGRKRIVARDGSHPDWSPDGTRIAYRVPTGIRFVTPAGVDVTPNHRTLLPAGVPAWSPDGTRLAVAAPTGVVIIPAAGGLPRPVTDRAGIGVRPAWYPLRRGRQTRGTSVCGAC